jgi:hypothetical protein
MKEQNKQINHEEEIEVSVGSCVNFTSTAVQYLANNKFQNKLTYALSRMIKQLKPIIEEFNEELEDVRIELASTDKNGNLIINKDTNNYVFTPDNTKKVKEKIKELREKTVKVKPYITTSIPTDLELVWYQHFIPFVLEDNPPEAKIKKLQ